MKIRPVTNLSPSSATIPTAAAPICPWLRPVPTPARPRAIPAPRGIPQAYPPLAVAATAPVAATTSAMPKKASRTIIILITFLIIFGFISHSSVFCILREHAREYVIIGPNPPPRTGTVLLGERKASLKRCRIGASIQRNGVVQHVCSG